MLKCNQFLNGSDALFKIKGETTRALFHRIVSCEIAVFAQQRDFYEVLLTQTSVDLPYDLDCSGKS